MTITESRWILLFKFGRRAHLEQFRNAGLLYMSPQVYFSALEADVVRSDPYEGTDVISQSNKSRLIIDQKNGERIVLGPQELVGAIKLRTGRTPLHNVYCMYGLIDPAQGMLVDERNFHFGDSFLIVLQTQAFIDRFATAASAANFGWKYGFVEYYDVETYGGDTGPFRKPSTFAYQKEFRFAIYPGSSQPITLSLGSVVDITSNIFPLADINKLVEIEVKDEETHLDETVSTS